VRRGGAAVVEKVVSEARADLRQAGFFFGERMKGLRRRGVPVDRIPVERWVELFRAFTARPVLIDAWQVLVREVAAQPESPISAALQRAGLDVSLPDWTDRLARRLAESAADYYGGDTERWRRFALGRALEGLRGRVPVDAVRSALEALAPKPAAAGQGAVETGMAG